MAQEIVKTDKRFRNVLFASYIACLVFLSLTFALGLKPFLAWLNSLNFSRMMTVSEIAITCLLLLFVAPACYLIVVGRKIIAAKRMPYPGQKVIRDTVIIEGKKAVRRGRMLLYLGIFGILLFIAGAARSYYLIEKFRHFNPFQQWNKTAQTAGAKTRGVDV